MTIVPETDIRTGIHKEHRKFRLSVTSDIFLRGKENQIRANKHFAMREMHNFMPVVTVVCRHELNLKYVMDNR